MKLTRIQKRTFKMYAEFRDRPMTVTGLIWVNRMQFGWQFAYYAFLTVLFGHFGSRLLGLIPVYLYLIFIYHDWFRLRRTVAVWPALREVISWEKLDQSLADSTNPPAIAK